MLLLCRFLRTRRAATKSFVYKTILPPNLSTLHGCGLRTHSLPLLTATAPIWPTPFVTIDRRANVKRELVNLQLGKPLLKMTAVHFVEEIVGKGHCRLRLSGNLCRDDDDCQQRFAKEHVARHAASCVLMMWLGRASVGRRTLFGFGNCAKL